MISCSKIKAIDEKRQELSSGTTCQCVGPDAAYAEMAHLQKVDLDVLSCAYPMNKESSVHGNCDRLS